MFLLNGQYRISKHNIAFYGAINKQDKNGIKYILHIIFFIPFLSSSDHYIYYNTQEERDNDLKLLDNTIQILKI